MEKLTIAQVMNLSKDDVLARLRGRRLCNIQVVEERGHFDVAQHLCDLHRNSADDWQLGFNVAANVIQGDTITLLGAENLPLLRGDWTLSSIFIARA
ncbi:MAG: hypothetical protein WAX89_06900 [Alphaproteobacteria bacterium]